MRCVKRSGQNREGVLSSNNTAYPDFSIGAEGAAAVILSIEGQRLTGGERTLFKDVNPLGFILFARNCASPDQLRALIDDVRGVLGRECPILIDQEGGRVQRLQPPCWRIHPPCKLFGDLALSGDLDQALEDCRFRTLRIAEDLLDCGINVNCDPVLDVFFKEAHDVIGDRAFAPDPDIVGRLGLSVCRQYIASGIVPVIKHIPGHGRAKADSHDCVPVIDAALEDLRAVDFKPFIDVISSDIGHRVWAMPSPVLYPAIDRDHPACTSAKLIQEIIRDEMGFDGMIISDAVDMGGFEAYGGPADRVKAVLDAGCDIALHCTGKFEEMALIAETAPQLSQKTLGRLKRAAA
jgi:beta-N-acetylhexosaminidase